MLQFNPYNLYTLGSIIHPLADMEAPKKLIDVFFTVSTAKRWLVSAYNQNLLPVSFSKSAMDSLYLALQSILPEDMTGIEFNSEVDASHIFAVKEAAKNFETVFAVELQNANTYFVEQLGIYNMSDLIARAELALGDSANVIGDEAKKDFKQAGRSLAFDLPTAAAFHLTRAIETVLRKYHALICPKSPNAGSRPEMATCINELRKAKEDPKLLDILDHFRDLHRNTTMHPEVFLETLEALRLFDIAKSGLNVMADRIQELSKTAAAPEATEPPPSLGAGQGA